ncbi:MAG: ribbon-helix-helix domain-containing protein [Solirubrobacterales bacterium]|nr:ribbon-helix-helix domain-containing protein [Solirubrobacterales bacterium]
MNKTTLYLPDDLRTAVKIAAARDGVSEAEVIRRAIRTEVGSGRPRPKGGLFAGGRPIAREVEQYLPGFGER